MNPRSHSSKLAVTMLLSGICALALRKGLYATAVDVTGLLLRNQPLSIALTVLTIGVLIRIALVIRKSDGCDAYEDNYRASLPAAIGNLAAGAGILATVLNAAPLMGGYLDIAWHYLGLIAPVCLLAAAIARALGKKPFFLLHVAACLFFLIHIVSHYQLWSGNPQMQDYVFSLLGATALMLFGFYAAAMEAGCGNRRMTLATGLAAIYLCLAELARSSCPWLYLGGILWVLTDLLSLQNPETP